VRGRGPPVPLVLTGSKHGRPAVHEPVNQVVNHRYKVGARRSTVDSIQAKARKSCTLCWSFGWNFSVIRVPTNAVDGFGDRAVWHLRSANS